MCVRWSSASENLYRKFLQALLCGGARNVYIAVYLHCVSLPHTWTIYTLRLSSKHTLRLAQGKHYTLRLYIVFIHCVYTLRLYIASIHCVYTLRLYIVFIHCVYTLRLYIASHFPHTLRVAQGIHCVPLVCIEKQAIYTLLVCGRGTQCICVCGREKGGETDCACVFFVTYTNIISIPQIFCGMDMNSVGFVSIPQMTKAFVEWIYKKMWNGCEVFVEWI